MEDRRFKVALVIRCAGHGGRCRRIIGKARAALSGAPGKPVLLLTNEGQTGRMDWPLLEEIVPADFSGSTGIIACPAHSHLITDKSVKSPPAYGLPGGKWARGMSVQLPFSLLCKPYCNYLELGVTQEVMWVPKPDTAIHVPDWMHPHD
jgi:hypothetical protein